MTANLRLSIGEEHDIIAARRSAREMARELGFGVVDQSRIATAVSELTRNVIRYATNSDGEISVNTISDADGHVGLEVVVSDLGPGMADVELALRDGFTSGVGMGMGLPGARRLMDEMTIDTELGKGTTVTARKWRR